MKNIFFILVMLLTLSCSNNPEDQLKHLNGYWEIDEVVMPDGAQRDYKISETIDYIEISDSMTGFRKKLQPKFDGSYITTSNAEALTIAIENDSLQIFYKTPYAQWQETVLNATEEQLIIESEDHIRYVYKRYQPIVIE